MRDRLTKGLGAVATARLPEAALAVLMAAAAAVLLHEGRGLTFWGDEWNFILTRRGDGVNDLFDAHVQHFSLVPVVIFRAMFAVFGIDDYTPYRVVTVAFHLLCTGLLFALVRQRIGARPALVAVIPVLFLGRAHEDLLWAFQIGFLAAIAAGLGALLALRRGSRRGDVAAALLLCLSLASSGVGIPFFVVAVAEVALSRSPSARSAAVLLVPFGVYALWYLGYGEPSAELANAPEAPEFAATLIAAAAGSVIGVGVGFGRMVALLGAYGAGRRAAASVLVRNRVLPPLCGLIAFAVSTGLARADDAPPEASRYLYPAAVLIVLAAGEALSANPPTRRATVALAVAAALVAVTNYTPLQNGADARRGHAANYRAALAAVEITRDTVAADHVLKFGLLEVNARDYLRAAADWGSPAYSEQELTLLPEPGRALADSALLAALRVAPVHGGGQAGGGRAPVVDGAAGGDFRPMRSCVKFEPHGPGATLDLSLPVGGLQVTARGAAELRLRRFVEGWSADPYAALEPGTTTLRIPRDRSARPWRARLTAAKPVTACGVS